MSQVANLFKLPQERHLVANLDNLAQSHQTCFNLDLLSFAVSISLKFELGLNLKSNLLKT